MRYIKVEAEQNLVRDRRSNAILETDLEKLKMHRAIRASKTNELNNLREQLEILKSMIKDSNGNNNN